MTESLIKAMVDMEEAKALQETKALLEGGCDPMKILEACSAAMEAVGKRFESGEYFLPHLMMAGEMLKQISDLIKPLIREEKTASEKGRVLIGTVKGDIHDIGKNIVTFLLETNGFEVRDIGIDQPPAEFRGRRPGVPSPCGGHERAAHARLRRHEGDGSGPSGGRPAGPGQDHDRRGPGDREGERLHGGRCLRSGCPGRRPALQAMDRESMR